MDIVDGKPPAWRFDAECFLWEAAHSMPAATSEEDFWRSMAEVVASRVDGGDPLLPALRGDFAAIAFLEWMRQNGRGGSLSSAELTALYSEHCAESQHVPTGENVMRKHLAHLPGVKKMQSDQTSDAGRRTRNYYWIISDDDGRLR